MRELRHPAILHWDMNHFVVLEKTEQNGIVVMDPAVGRLPLSWTEASSRFTGVALELTPSADWKRIDHDYGSPSLFDLLKPYKKWRGELFPIVALTAVLEILILLVPLQLRASVDHGVQMGDAQFVTILGSIFVAIVALLFATSLARTWLSTIFSIKLGLDLHERFVQGVLNQPAQFFLKHHTADLLHRSRSVSSIQAVITARLIQAVIDGIMTFALAVMAVLVVPLLGTVILFLAAANVTFSALLREASIEASRRQLRAAGQTDALFLENARSARTIQLFGKTAIRTALWRNKLVEQTNQILRAERVMMFSREVAQVTGYATSVVVVALGTYLAIIGTASLGTVLMIFFAQALLVNRLNNCVNYFMELRRLQGHMERVLEVLPNPNARIQEGQKSNVERTDSQATVELRDVWFRFGKDAPWILEGVNLRVDVGEAVAITGASGCGKSTLVALVLGLLQPCRGEVLIGGRNLASLTPDARSQYLGAVLQDDALFQGTIAENIAFFEQPIDMERVAHCAKQANISDEIALLPMGYYSLLAEGGSDLSGGQRQRVFIARALYHAPKILLLDEATSHLDSKTETAVSDAISRLQITRISIAHRSETLRMSSRVLLLQDGVLQLVRADLP